MRIAQVAPLYERVPPTYYGGTERVVSYLTEALVQMGHQVTLYASGDSVTAAELIACCRRSLRLDPSVMDQLVLHVAMLERVVTEADRFDIIHNHVDYLFYPFARRLRVPHVTTLHGRLDLPELVPLYRTFAEAPVVSISDAQRAPLPWLRWATTIHHGLPLDLHRFREAAGGYLAFIGRISPEKRVDRAIEIATRARLPFKIAAKVDDVDRRYFETTIVPLLDHPLVEFLGEIDEQEKDNFLGHAAALLFPINWPEPFGLAMIEALACGTPVVAYRHGSVPEVLEHGRTGFVVDSLEDALTAVEQLPRLRRRDCRDAFESRFSARRMAEDYLTVYQRLMTAPACPTTHHLALR
jgi:glycosyltransferase involved in cell wall biosynthesis